MPTVAQLLEANPRKRDIKFNKARGRRQMYVAEGIMSDIAKQRASGQADPREVQGAMARVDDLQDKAAAAYGARLLKRKAEAIGRKFDPTREADPQMVEKAGELRMKAAKLGYQIRAIASQTGQPPPEMIAEAQRYRVAAEDLIHRILGTSKEDEVNANMRWGAAGKEDLRRKTMAHYGRKAASGDTSAQRVVSGFEANRDALQSVLDQAYRQVGPSGYSGRSGQFRAEHGARMARYPTKGSKRSYQAMKGKAGAKMISITGMHIETIKKQNKAKAMAAQRAKARKEAQASSNYLRATPARGIRRGSFSDRARVGSLRTHIAMGSRGAGRVHSERLGQSAETISEKIAVLAGQLNNVLQESRLRNKGQQGEASMGTAAGVPKTGFALLMMAVRKKQAKGREDKQ